MTVPFYTNDEFIDYIKLHGWNVKSHDYWNDYNILILEKNDAIFTFHCHEKYFYIEVVRTCELLKIPPPPDHIHQYYLHHKMQGDKCYCGEDILFKDCHGKD